MITNSLIRTPLVLLCLYGLFKEFRPSEPFLTEYLIDPRWVNLSKNELYASVYPVYTYATFSLVLPVFLFTDYVRYKPIIVLEGVSYISTWILLLWTKGVTAMQIMQVTYGIAVSTEIAYYTYIYAKTPSEDYLKVSSFSRAAILFGRCCSGIFSQILTINDFLDYRELNFVSLGSVSLALLFSLLLPSVQESIYFDRKEETSSLYPTTGEPETNQESNQRSRQSFKSVLLYLKNAAYKSYSSTYIIKWSFWVIISTCCNYQVGNYIQPLWEEIKPSTNTSDSTGWNYNEYETPFVGPFNNNFHYSNDNENDTEIYNGYVEAGTALLGALAVSAIGFVKLDWYKLGDACVVLVSITSGILLFFMSGTENIWLGYIGYSVFRIIYQILMTVASFEIVKELNSRALDCYALVFGINMFFALGTQTILTAVVNDVLELNPRIQFLVYAAFYIVPLLIFTLLIVRNIYHKFSVRMRVE